MLYSGKATFSIGNSLSPNDNLQVTKIDNFQKEDTSNDEIPIVHETSKLISTPLRENGLLIV